MKLLVTNDDGIEAPGIAALAEVASQLGEVIVAAPMQGVSSCGHHVTTHRDVAVKEVRPRWFAIDGYPADCVRIALSALGDDFDWVLSGINDGGNLGMDLLMSGTASAAREAALRGVGGIALSQYKAKRGDANWERAMRWTAPLLQRLLSDPAPPNSFWNLNLPDPSEERGSPPLVKCDYDRLPLPVDGEFISGVWRYVSRYQSRSRSEGLDVAQCFNGAITLSLVPCFH